MDDFYWTIFLLDDLLRNGFFVLVKIVKDQRVFW